MPKLLKVSLANIFLFLLLLELVGLVDFWQEEGSLYYLGEPTPAAFTANKSNETSASAYRLHPYFGYTIRPIHLTHQERTAEGVIHNNFGFNSPFSYPYERQDPSEYVVALLGGSVAAKLAIYERQHRLISRTIAAETGRDVSQIRILNLAQGGFKQPQQALIYNYFRSLGQHFDLVLAIDGFNEVALGALNAKNNLRVDMPSIGHIRPLRNLSGEVPDEASLQRTFAVRAAQRQYVDMYERTYGDEAWELAFAGGFFLRRKLTKFYGKRYRKALLTYSQAREHDAFQDRWLALNPRLPNNAAPKSDVIDEAIRVWANGAELVNSLQQADGGHYLHFVQPNQYHPTARLFSEGERQIAFDATSPYAEIIVAGYPPLLTAAASMAASGFPIEDLTTSLDEIEQAAYSDSCCHYTDAGQRVIATRVARAVARLSKVTNLESRVRPGQGVEELARQLPR